MFFPLSCIWRCPLIQDSCFRRWATARNVPLRTVNKFKASSFRNQSKELHPPNALLPIYRICLNLGLLASTGSRLTEPSSYLTHFGPTKINYFIATSFPELKIQIPEPSQRAKAKQRNKMHNTRTLLGQTRRQGSEHTLTRNPWLENPRSPQTTGLRVYATPDHLGTLMTSTHVLDKLQEWRARVCLTNTPRQSRLTTLLKHPSS